ncbi:uroporphyrinogen-III C-methyltransferase [Desulfurivibrio alkaliphilus]|uniref:uroporphyrinogen-III C-methyltransferase n=1 Tax=Desulfurivibrio alkaliphilus (strain DSM 19089 / UNIQEM U267 / AHT2) TaxID=589865 RepID=D6Z0L3_DESAT|nr:uroporphyrinogen-III C-methyltransferase [Desulfurivibrio alkaliphilus]ADH85242.1 uroporphyrin-III C-methyltransferase [Desulfurivibrio alkaliphilus AHT 2]
MSKKGKVYLVGAGPGDPELITVKGKRLLGRAEVVVYDYLANKKLLAHVPPTAVLIYAGKKGGSTHTHSQTEINQMLVDHALGGKTVVRLKGGDPFIFGRGGEEIEELSAHGVPFEVVPGVTSASAAATYAGVPITHRAFTSSVAFITGHEDPNKKESRIAWDKLATGVGTLVFYMGIKNLPNIVANLIKHGRDPQTPVAVVRWASTPEQRSVVGTLASISEVVRQAGITPPALVVVGEVVSLREVINWYEKRPLFGKKILVTRSREQASELVQSLEDLGADCLEGSTIALAEPPDWAPLDQALDKIATYNWLLFTSPNAVNFFFKRLAALGLDSRRLHGPQIAVVGTATAEALQNYGIKADLLPARFTAEGLAEALLAQGVSGRKILLPRALKAREVLPESLRAAGAEVDIAPVYQNTRPPMADEIRQALERQEVDLITFTSSSTASNLFALLNWPAEELARRLAGVKIAAIGPITAATVEKAGLKVDIQPETHTIPEMVSAIAAYYL